MNRFNLDECNLRQFKIPFVILLTTRFNSQLLSYHEIVFDTTFMYYTR